MGIENPINPHTNDPVLAEKFPAGAPTRMVQGHDGLVHTIEDSNEAEAAFRAQEREAA